MEESASMEIQLLIVTKKNEDQNIQMGVDTWAEMKIKMTRW